MAPAGRRFTSWRSRLRGRAWTSAGSPVALSIALLAGAAGAQTLAVRRFDIPDGLAHSRVGCVLVDSRGYLWCGTWEGLSRFDGVSFKSYGARDGLVLPLINTLVEDRRGRLWVGLNSGGLARLRDGESADPGAPLFVAHAIGSDAAAGNVAALAVDGRDRLWCGTEAGVYRCEEAGDGRLEFRAVLPAARTIWSQQLAADAAGRVWFGDERELVRLDVEPPVRCVPPSGFGDEPIAAVCGAAGDRLYVAQDHALHEVELDDGAPARWIRLPIGFAPDQRIRALLRDSHERLWIGTSNGLVLWSDGAARTLTTAQGLVDNSIRSLCEDRDGGIWMGTWSNGVCQITGAGIRSWGRSESFRNPDVVRVIESRSGRIYASTTIDGVYEIRDDGAIPIAASRAPPFVDVHTRVAQDHRGDWWLGTGEGLYWSRGPELDLRERRRLGADDGVPDAAVFGQPFEDSLGRIWVGFFDQRLYRWDPARSATPRFESVADGDLPRLGEARLVFEDHDGTIWLASFQRFGRLREDRVELESAREGLPDLRARCFFQDSAGRLWIGLRFHGVSMTTDPAAERPEFRNWATRDGLSSDTVWSIAEDASGLIHLGTGRGIDVLDPRTGRIRNLGAAQGLPGHQVNNLLRDHAGRIWAATTNGVSCIEALVRDRPAAPPAVYIERVQVAGEEIPLPARGARELALPDAIDEHDHLTIDFVCPSLSGDRTLRFQTRLEGGDGAWSPPQPLTSVRYAGLAPGTYAFSARAIDLETGDASEPARLQLRVLAPVWRRPWFVAACALAVGGAAIAWHRMRLRQALALERIRSQIALDLHDDLGANLSQIAILSEVARRAPPAEAGDRLGQIAELARSMRESMGDIVWAVDPRKDRASELVRRMRQAGNALVESDGLALDFRAPPEAEIEGLELAPDQRRHLLMMFKEALNNVVRHARASRVDVELARRGAELVLDVRDDGCGFAVGAAGAGNGLRNLRLRAQALRGRAEVRSGPGAGTHVRVSVPLRPA